MRTINRLSAKAIAKITGGGKPGRYGDGANLNLQLKNGGASWVFRYRQRGTHKIVELGLGPLATVPLAAARARAKAFNDMLASDDDPAAIRVAKRAAIVHAITFGDHVETFLANALEGHKNEKHKKQWRATLETYAKPLWPMKLQAIEPADVARCLEPIWLTKPETARRVRGRIQAVMDHARAAKLRAGDNPAALDIIRLLMPKQKGKAKHHAAMALDALPGFMSKLRGLKSVSARALEFAILTACRTGEVRGATWPEISTVDALWTIPGERMKAGKEHRVPLCARALAIVDEMKTASQKEFVFAGANGGPLSDQALLMCLRGLAPGVTTHGFRSSFRDWAGDVSSFPRDLAEAALAHTIKDKTEAAYRRSDALAKRAKMMQQWATFLGS